VSVSATVTFGDFFSYAAPAGWGWTEGSTFGLSQEEKGVFGGTLHGPGRGAVPLTIELHYYAKGNLLDESADRYIRGHADPSPGSKAGEDLGPNGKATVSGRNATVFETRRSRLVPMPAESGGANTPPWIQVRPGIRAHKESIVERFVVIPASAGFYALRYRAPAAEFVTFLPVFERVTASFRALR